MRAIGGPPRLVLMLAEMSRGLGQAAPDGSYVACAVFLDTESLVKLVAQIASQARQFSQESLCKKGQGQREKSAKNHRSNQQVRPEEKRQGNQQYVKTNEGKSAIASSGPLCRMISCQPASASPTISGVLAVILLAVLAEAGISLFGLFFGLPGFKRRAPATARAESPAQRGRLALEGDVLPAEGARARSAPVRRRGGYFSATNWTFKCASHILLFNLARVFPARPSGLLYSGLFGRRCQV